MKRLLCFCGVLAPIVYVCTVIYGGLITPGYSHAANAISELVMSGAPLRWKIDPGFTLYNLMLLCFAIGLIGEFRRSGDRPLTVSALMLAAIPVLSLLMYFFPQDPRGTALTFGGAMHLLLAGAIAPLTVFLILIAGLSFRRHPELASLWGYSLLTSVFVLVTGILTARGLATGSPIFGILERLTIGGFIQWVFVVALRATALCGAPRRAAV